MLQPLTRHPVPCVVLDAHVSHACSSFNARCRCSLADALHHQAIWWLACRSACAGLHAAAAAAAAALLRNLLLFLQAKAWLGNEAATCIHCNMIAAALTWNSYVGFKHSDLDFFAGRLQHAAGC